MPRRSRSYRVWVCAQAVCRFYAWARRARAATNRTTWVDCGEGGRYRIGSPTTAPGLALPHRPLDLAVMPPKRTHPPTEPQPHLDPFEPELRVRTLAEIALAGILAVLAAFLVLAELARSW